MNLFVSSSKIFLASASIAVSISAAFAAESSAVDHHVQDFLQKLNAGGGKPIEQLPPAQARKVLAGAPPVSG